MRFVRTVSALLTVICVSAPSAGLAATIVGGETRVEVTADLAALGLTPGIIGTASIVSGSPLTVAFPITGGSLDGALAGSILHEGSGVSLTAGGNSLALTNFIIDTVGQRILGDAALNGSALAEDLSLFTFDLSTITVDQLLDLDNPALGLFFTAEAAGALTSVFGAPDLTGAQFGLAATSPVLAAVPEPSTWAMLIVGFGLAGTAVRRKSVLRTATC